jgi:TRAP-type transport system periplasmic protein
MGGRARLARGTRQARLVLGAGISLGSLASVRPGSVASVMMRFGSDSPIEPPHTSSGVALKQIVESRTAGRIAVSIFPHGQLCSNRVMANSIKSGTLDAVVTDMSHIRVAVPETYIFNLPFVYRETEHVLRFANGPAGRRLEPRIEDAFACEVLGFASDGSRNLWSGKHPIRTAADVVGLKMALGSSKNTGLQTGLVDGSDRTTSEMIALKLYRVTRYLTLTNHFSIVSVLIVSKRFMSKLGPEDRAVVREARQAAVETQLKGSRKARRLRSRSCRKKESKSLRSRAPGRSPTSSSPCIGRLPARLERISSSRRATFHRARRPIIHPPIF